MTETRTALISKAHELLDRHSRPSPLVLPNIWDVASARAVEEVGFPAIATSSKAIAAVLGLTDDDSSDPDVIFDYISRIAGSVTRPVTADLEAGYGLSPEELVERLLAAGVVGCNLEDTDHRGSGVLVDGDKQAEFISEVREAAEVRGVHIVINARVDTFIRHVGNEEDQLEGAIRRGRLYLAAGADCVYPIALSDRELIERLISALPGPTNVSVRQGCPSIDELAALGVRRISFASRLFQQASDEFHSKVRQLAEALPSSSIGAL